MEWFELWLCALVLTFGLLFSTGQKNGYAHIEEDIYLPQHYCKSTKLFYIIHEIGIIKIENTNILCTMLEYVI